LITADELDERAAQSSPDGLRATGPNGSTPGIPIGQLAKLVNEKTGPIHAGELRAWLLERGLATEQNGVLRATGLAVELAAGIEL
jgi:hypothetical protein